MTEQEPSHAIQGRNEIKWRPGKKQVWFSHVRTWDLSEANLLYLRMCLWH